MGAAAEDLDLRQRDQRRVGAAEVVIQRLPGRRGGGVRGGHRHRQDGVGAQPGLVAGAVQLDQPLIQRLLVRRVDAGDRVGDDRR